MGGDEALPFVDFLFWVFCTERFDLEIHPAGLDTEKISWPEEPEVLDLLPGPGPGLTSVHM